MGGKGVENMTKGNKGKTDRGIKGKRSIAGAGRGVNRRETDQPLKQHDSGGKGKDSG